MPIYPNDYYLTRQEIEDLRVDAKQASKVATGLFYDAIPFSEVESMHQKISKINPLDRK